MAAEEYQIGGMVARLHNLNIEMGRTEDEAVEGLADALEMEVEEYRGGKGEDEVGGTQRALGALEFLTQIRSYSQIGRASCKTGL